MGFGFSAVNDSGEIQIDQDYYNPRLFKEGSKNAVRDAAGAYQAMRVTFTGRDNPPLVAAQPGSSLWMGVAQVTQSGGKYDSVVFHHQQAINTTIACPYAFYDADGGIASSTNYGMQVFAANGDVVFDSRNAYLSVVDIVSIPKPSSGTVITTTHTHTSLPNAYYVLNSLNGIVVVPSLPIALVLMRGIRQKTNTSLEIQHGVVGLASVVDIGFDTRTATEILVCEKIAI